MLRRSDIASVLIIGAGALLMGQALARQVRMPAPTHEQTIGAVTTCGVPAANVRITYEDEWQSDVVWISDLGGADEARFRCLKDVVHPIYIVMIEAEDQRNAYHAFASREDHARYKGEAIEGLKAAGLLGRVPRYDPRKGLKTFARGLEAACSIRAGRALETLGSSGLTIRRSFFANPMTKIHDELTCLLGMAAASNADEQGISLGFTGAEAPIDGRP